MPHLGEPGKVYRVVTTLLNPRVAPALTLLTLYHERWEIELVIDEVKTHEPGQRKVLRSKTPEGVRQELYGIYLAHKVEVLTRWTRVVGSEHSSLSSSRTMTGGARMVDSSGLPTEDKRMDAATF